MFFAKSVPGAPGHVMSLTGTRDDSTWTASVDSYWTFWGELSQCREWLVKRAFGAIRPTEFIDPLELIDAIGDLMNDARSWLSTPPGQWGLLTANITPDEARLIAER